MTIEQKRMAIAEVYPYKKWSDKVDNMSDNQVIGVYNSFLKSGKLGPKCVKEPKPMQMHIYDMISHDLVLQTGFNMDDQKKLNDICNQFGIHFCKGCGAVLSEEGYCESCQDIIEAFESLEAAMTEGLKDENIY